MNYCFIVIGGVLKIDFIFLKGILIKMLLRNIVKYWRLM